MKILARLFSKSFPLLAALFLAFAADAWATVYTVTTTTDHPIPAVGMNGVIVGGAGNGQITLRSAIHGANASTIAGSATHTVNVPAGTYNLSQNNLADANGYGTIGGRDLVVGAQQTAAAAGSNITITGTGVTPSKIVQTIAGFDVITTGYKQDGSPAVVALTLQNLEITGGTFTGIYTGMDNGTNRSSTTIQNCNIHDNTNGDAVAGQGGAIQNTGGDLIITGTTFTSNSATHASTGQGGAIYYSIPNPSGSFSQGNLTITGCTFTGNSAAVGAGFPAGGAIFVSVVSGGTALNIQQNSFVNNTATAGNGGAVALLNTTRATTLTFNRFVGNTATNGSAVNNASVSTVTANQCWWNHNTGPAANEITGNPVTATTWLQLKLAASPATIGAGQTSALTASFLSDSANAAVAPANLGALIGRAVTFTPGAAGSITSPDATILNSGTAGATYNAATTAGVSTTTAQVDGVTASAGVTVTPGPATHFTVSAPANTTAGAAFSATVTARDQFNNTATGYTGTVHFTSSDGTATLPANYTFTAGDNGVHTFTNGVTFVTAGNQTLTATDTVTGTINGTSGGVAVAAGAATNFTVSAPASAQGGTPFSVTVTAKDQFNNTKTNYTGTVHFTSSDGTATLPANYTFTAGDNGVRTFTNGVTFATGGNQTVTATDTLTGSINGTSGAVAVVSVTHFTVSAPASATAGTPVSVTVSALDASNNVVPGYRGTVHFTSTDGPAVLPANYTFTAGDSGVHTFANGVTLKTAGSQTVTATDTLTASVNGTSGNVTVAPSAATQFAVAAPATTAPSVPFTVTVSAKDQFNNTVPSYTGTVHFTKTDGGAGSALPADYTFVAGDNGVHIFTNGVTLVTLGNQTVTATDTVTGSITGFASTNVIAPPTVTPNTASLAIIAPTITINGTGFSTTPANNTVLFNLGAAGTVTSASATQMVVSFTAQPSTTGVLTAVVANQGVSSGAPVQVATVVPTPSISLVLDVGAGSAVDSGVGGFPFTQGSRFTTAASFTVKSLAYVDAEGNGLGTSHDVAIWNDAGTLVAGPVTISGTDMPVPSANGFSKWFVKNLPAPVVLPPGTYRVAALIPASPLDKNVSGTVQDAAVATRSAGYVRNNTFVATLAFPDQSFSSIRTTASFSGDSLGSAPIVTANPTSTLVNEGAIASFNAAATGSPVPAVQWQMSTNGGGTFTDIPGATTIPLSFATTFSQNQAQFRAVFTNGIGSPATTTAATLTVNRLPVAAGFSLTRYPTQPVKVSAAQTLALGAVSDPDAGDTVSVTAVGAPAHGTATLSGGYVFYTPAAGYLLGDMFTYTVSDNHGATATATITVNIVTDNTPTNNITRMVHPPGGNVDLDFAGIPGFTYGLQYTDNLANPWQNIGPVLVNSVGAAHFTDTDPVRKAAPAGFYRFIYPAP